MITEEHFTELDALLTCALDNEHLLTDWENGFVSDFSDRLGKYHDDVKVTDKQQAIFDRIRFKLEKGGVI